jgi:hypothetical protein
MTRPLVLRELPAVGAAQWDQLLTRYPDATVFHSSPWHEALNDTLPGTTLRFAVESDGRVVGHWCGFMVRKFGVKVFGAPLPGTGTDYMYPLFAGRVPPAEFLAAVRTWADSRGVSMVDLGGEYLDDSTLTAAGYKLRPTRTYRVDLTGGAPAVWSRLKPAMRNKVRKAEKQGVTIETDASADFSALFFDMLQAVFRRQNKVPTYSLPRIDAVVRRLQAAGTVVPLVARRNGEPLASVILLLDGTAGYYWGGASYEAAYPVGANDLIQWHALQLLTAKGLRVYDACGGGEYKEKFGGVFHVLPAGHLVLHRVVGLVRASVEKGFKARQAILGTMQRMAGSRQ